MRLVYYHNSINYNLPMLQGTAELHGIFSVPLPMQSEPPFDGCGLLQFLILVWIPLPQVSVHELQLPQKDQLPSN